MPYCFVWWFVLGHVWIHCEVFAVGWGGVGNSGCVDSDSHVGD